MTPPPPHRPVPRARRRTARTLAAGLCLTTALALAACSDSTGSDSAASDPTTTGRAGLATRTAAPTMDPVPTASPTKASGLATRTGAPPSFSPRPAWTPPSLKFYNEDYSVWYQDDSVVNSDAVTEHGNIEGYRTHSGTCIGYETRDISEAIYRIQLDDDTMSASLVPVNESTISEYTEWSRETLDLVRDDGGTMEGYSITWSGVFTYDDGTTEMVEGYKFARAVGAAGLEFSVMAMCKVGSNITPDQWQTILRGIRIEGLTAGKMAQ